jgi:hypothetical protein
LQIPLDSKVPLLSELPYTISFAIRKRMQVDNLYQLKKEERPPDLMIWGGTPEQIDDWLERVRDPRLRRQPEHIFISELEVEG